MATTHGAQQPPRTPAVLGLTGNIACGKSSVLAILAELGALTIDADALTHRALAKGGGARDAVMAAFGTGIVGPDGEIDRRALGARVFADRVELRRLERLVQPHVRLEIERILDGATREVVVDAIKLFEGGLARRCNEVWVVACPPEKQLERLMRRNGLTEDQARVRIRAQPPQEERLHRADVVIDNGGAPDDTRAQVESAWARFTRRSGRRTADESANA